MANHRTGRSRGYRGQPGGAHTVPWREDDVILDRMVQVATLRAQGKKPHEIARELGVSHDVVTDDTNRLRELRAERMEGLTDELNERLEVLERRLWELLDTTSNTSLNKSALAGQIRQVIMDRAKFNGLLIEKRELTGKDGGPIEVADAVRERLAGRIAELAARGETQPTPEQPD